MSFSYATVTGVVSPSVRLRRITLRVDEPDVLAVRPEPDSAVGVYFSSPGPDGSRIPPPVATGVDGVRYADTSAGADGRNYSVRAQRGDLIDLDVVLHARGLGTTWATQTRPGDRVGLDHARSWYRPPPDCEWQLLVTDLSGLPATARILERSAGDVRTVVVAEVADESDLTYLAVPAGVTLLPSVGSGNGHAQSRLAATATTLPLPAGRGYCWFAGEAAESRVVRKHFRGLGWDVDQLDVTGYWRFDSETWDAKFALIEDDVVAVYTRALAAGKGDKVASEEFDEALERAGL